MTNNIILSICIATLNRAAFLEETLNSIILQATNEIEIVIVDGASTDNTEEVVKNHQQKFPFIRYLRLTAKGGYDQDQCRAVELSTGKYCWLFSDDDILKPGAINAVLAEIHHDYGLILVNSEIRNINLAKVVKERCLKFKTNQIYQKEDSEKLFIDVASYVSFLGCIVIKRSLWDQRNKESYFGTLFVHVGVIFQSLISEGTIVLAKPMISIRYGNALWTNRCFEISLLIWSKLIWSFADFSEPAKSRVCPQEPWRSLKTLIFYRARGAYTRREYKQFVKRRLNSSIERFIALFIAILPGILVNFGLYMYLSLLCFKNPNAGTRRIDLENSIYYYKRYPFTIMKKIIGLKGKLSKGVI